MIFILCSKHFLPTQKPSPLPNAGLQKPLWRPRLGHQKPGRELSVLGRKMWKLIYRKLYPHRSKEKISGSDFKIQGTYFKLSQTYFLRGKNRDENHGCTQGQKQTPIFTSNTRPKHTGTLANLSPFPETRTLTAIIRGIFFNPTNLFDNYSVHELYGGLYLRLWITLKMDYI